MTHRLTIPPKGWYKVAVVGQPMIIDAETASLSLPLEMIEGSFEGYPFVLVCRLTSQPRSMCRNLALALGTEACLPGTLNLDFLDHRRMQVYVRQVNDAVKRPCLRIVEVQPIPGDPLSGNRLNNSPAGWCERKRRGDEDLSHLLGPRRTCVTKDARRGNAVGQLGSPNVEDYT